MCLKVIRPRIISCLVIDPFSWFWLSLSISFIYHHHFIFFFLHFPTFCRIISKHFSHLPFTIGILFLLWRQSSIFIIFEPSFFYICPPVWRVILGRGSEKETIRLKRGNKWIIFYTSKRIEKDGHLSFQTQLPNWRVIP